MIIMIMLGFFSWWYGIGWKQTITNLQKRVAKTNSKFSVPILLKTLFSPWRRIITNPAAGLSEHIQAWADNLVSRAVGFVIRLLVLFAALISEILILIISLIELIVWPLLPPTVIILIILGLFS